MLTDGQMASLYGRTPTSWTGWRFTDSGRYLITPDGTRMTPERLRGVAWRIAAEARRDAARARRKAKERQSVKVVVVDLADWQARQFGARAG